MSSDKESSPCTKEVDTAQASPAPSEDCQETTSSMPDENTNTTTAVTNTTGTVDVDVDTTTVPSEQEQEQTQPSSAEVVTPEDGTTASATGTGEDATGSACPIADTNTNQETAESSQATAVVTHVARVDESTIPLEWTKMGKPTGADAPPIHLYYPSDVQEYLPEDTEESLYLVGTHGHKVTHMGKDLWKSCAFDKTETLVLRSHIIAKMEGLEGFTNLQTLELYDNQISALECLNNHSTSHSRSHTTSASDDKDGKGDDDTPITGDVNGAADQNDDKDEENGGGLPGQTLRVLDMSFNVIRDMQPVQFCPNLVELCKSMFTVLYCLSRLG
jgi:Leucine-rich repeat (LRR) protein